MLLRELFSDDGDMLDQMSQQVLDFLTPLAAKGVKHIPIQSVADVLKSARTGITIDRGLIMRLIDPNICKFVSKVDGDIIYLALPVDKMSARTDDDIEKEQEKIANTASAVAKQEIGK